MRPARIISSVVLLGFACGLAGCGGTRTEGFGVRVTDAGTGEPIEGAVVWVQGATAAAPMSIEALLGGGDEPVRDADVTDAQGRARLTRASNLPFSLSAWRPGYDPASVWSDEFGRVDATSTQESDPSGLSIAIDP